MVLSSVGGPLMPLGKVPDTWPPRLAGLVLRVFNFEQTQI